MKANWRNVRNVRPKEFSTWTFQPPKASPEKPKSGGSFMTATLQDLPNSDRFFEKVLGLFASPGTGEAMLVRQQGVVGNEEQFYLELANLQHERSEALIPLSGEIAFLDGFGPEVLIMYRPEAQGFGNEATLHIDKIESGRLVPYASWEPYAHEDWEPRKDIENAWFLDADRVMTLNHSGSALTVWDVASATATFSIPIKNTFQLKLAFNPGRSLMATTTDDKIAIIDLAKGEHVATIPTSGVDYGALVFRSNNQQLAGVANQTLTVWDLTTGEIVREFGHSALRSTVELAWPGDFVLVDNRYLFDIDRRVLLWEYSNSLSHMSTSTFVDGYLVFVPHSHSDEDPATVNAVALPHPEAAQLAERLGSPEDLLALQPGDEVSLELEIDPGVAAEAELRESLQKALESAGFKIVESSRNVVTAICKQQEQQTIRINTDNRWRVREGDIVERTIVPYASYVKITVNGKEVWSVGYIARPGHIIWMQDGESLDDALQRLTRPNVDLIKNVRFAPYIARQGEAGSNGAYGISNLTSAGITTNPHQESF
jgi:hypothetical protein